MDAYSAVREAARRSGVPVTQIGPRLGRDRSYVSSLAAHAKNPKADTLAAMLSACGWSLCAVPMGDVPDSAIVLDPD